MPDLYFSWSARFAYDFLGLGNIDLGSARIVVSGGDTTWEVGEDIYPGATYVGYSQFAVGSTMIKLPVIVESGVTQIFNTSNFNITFPDTPPAITAAPLDINEGYFNYDMMFQYDGSTGALINGSGPGSILDRDLDQQFETGDSLNPVLYMPYLGTVMIDGVEAPAFVIGSSINVYYRIPTDAETPPPLGVPTTLPPVLSGPYSLALCFAAGTRIATPDGERAVERLQAGDTVLTADGRAARVLWIGRQTLWRAQAQGQLVCIRAGALGSGLPVADLTVTADHGMVLDGFIATAAALVNGTTIDWVAVADLPDRFTVYHVETQAHDVILANGAPAETFIDAASRAAFDNHAEYLALHGVDRIVPEMPLPRVTSQRLLPETIRRRLGIGCALPRIA